MRNRRTGSGKNPDRNLKLGRKSCEKRRTPGNTDEDHRGEKSADSGMPDLFRTPESDEPEAVSRTREKVQWKNTGEKRKDREIWSDCYFVQTGHSLKK